MERERWREGRKERWSEREMEGGRDGEKKEHRNYIRKMQNQKKGEN